MVRLEIIFILLFLFFSCANNNDSKVHLDESNILNSNNIFRLDTTNIIVDIKNTSALIGEWKVESGYLTVLRSFLDVGDKVVFIDTMRKVLNGWGTFEYNRSVKIYMNEYGSDVYEFMVNDQGYLVLFDFVYRNDDLSLKDKPEVFFNAIDINLTENDQLILHLEKEKAILKKINYR